MSAQTRKTKEKTNKWDYIKLKSFCPSIKQDTTYQMKEDICKSHI